MKMLKYYKLYSWMIAELGFTREMGAYLLIYSFYENGMPCSLSKSQFADALDCTRMQAIRILKALEDEKYIISEKREMPLSAVYRINEETARRMQADSNMDVTSTAIPDSNIHVTSNINVTTDSNMDVTSDSNTDVTTDSNMDVTQIENIKREHKKESEKRVCDAPAPDSERKDFVSIPDYPEIKLTQSGLDKLMHGVNYEKAKRKGFKGYLSLLDSQLAKGKVYPDHFRQLRHWITEDGGRFLDDQTTEQNKQNAAQVAAIMDNAGFSEINMDFEEVRAIKDPNTGEEVLCKKTGQDEYYREIGGKGRTFSCFGDFVEEVW